MNNKFLCGYFNLQGVIDLKLKRIKKLTERDLLKLEVAEQLGLGDKLREHGWSGLTASESGKIGGYLTKRKADNERKDKCHSTED